jgi:hypothetical protein
MINFMRKGLQVILDCSEMHEVQRTERMKRLTVAEWVRQVLRSARWQEPIEEAGKKIQAIRAWI